MEKKFVSWRRAYTRRKGVIGLSLESQSSIIDYFVKAEQGELIADFVETYTGKELKGCTELRKAMAYCKEQGATLIIAKCDRFRCTEEALEIYNKMSGNIYFCDLPETSRFMLALSFDIAEREALLVSIWTKKALSAKKVQGYKLGSPKGVDLSKANAASARIRREAARNKPYNKIIWGIIGQNGTPTAEDAQRMSDLLNQMGVKTATGLDFTPERVRTTYHNLKKIFREHPNDKRAEP